MFISAWFAIILPFETFLFSYAVLGPLHYLTEINWLQSKKYFLPQINNISFKYLVLIVSVLLFFSSLYVLDFYLQIFAIFYNLNIYKSIKYAVEKVNYFYLYFAFMIAIGWVFFNTIFHKWLWIIITALFGLVCIILEIEHFITWFTIFLPTIVHVWFFTGLFILFGATTSKSISGWISILVFVLISISLFFVHHNTNTYQISNYTKESFVKSNFNSINVAIFNFLFKKYPSHDFVLNSQIGLKIQSLIAFSYTYHYLNWFSKISIIKWHKISSNKLVITGIFWFTCLGLYFYNYSFGLAALYFLSVLHVVLEFPLNAYVFKQLVLSKNSTSV